MGRRGKESSFEQRQLVIWHHAKGKTYRAIASMLKMKKSTVADIIKRFKDEDRIESHGHTGRLRFFSPREETVIVRKI